MNSASLEVKPKLIICKETVKIGQFEIKYVQPIPLPQTIAWLQELKMEGLDFVKIPVSDKEDKLYLIKSIRTLLGLSNINTDTIEKLIKDYNMAIPLGSSTLALETNSKSRDLLFAIVKISQYIAESRNVEFLTA